MSTAATEARAQTRPLTTRASRDLQQRPTYWATQLSLTRLAAGLTAAGLLWLAGWIVLAPPENVPGPWLGYGMVTTMLAAVTGVSAVWPQLPGSRWAPVATTTIALISLATVSGSTGLVGWWPTMELAALLALSATVALPTVAAALAQVAIVAFSLALMMRHASSFVVAVGPASVASALARLIVAAVTLLVGNAVLRRAATTTDALVARESRQREVLETEARTRRTNRDARRFLHDSGMNSLEAVSRGVPPDRVTELRTRCAADAERWLQAASAPGDDTQAAFRPVIAEAHVRGLTVDSRFTIDGRLPDDVLSEVAEAAGEALRNCAKHAGVTTAQLIVAVGQGTATVDVIDSGRGFDATAATTRLGLAESIRGRMRDIGGEARIESAPGQGTRVTLHWPVATSTTSHASVATLFGGSSASATTATATAINLPDMLARLAWLPIAAVALGAAASTAVNWWSVHLPWLLGASGVAVALATGWTVRRWRAGRLDTFDLSALTLTLVIATLVAPVADPFCSAASGPPLIPDGRLVALAVIGVLVASWRVSAAVVAVTLAALSVAALLWLQLWPICAAETVPTGIGLALVAVAGVAFGKAVRSQESAAKRAAATMAATKLDLARDRADALVRAEWEITAVAEVRDLLRTIADPATDLDDPGLRASAGDAAARLRALVRASELPGPLATVLSKLVELGRVNGFPVAIEGALQGDTEDLHAGRFTATADDALLLGVAGELDRWLASHAHRATSAGVTLSDFDGFESVMLRLDSAAGRQAPATVTAAGTGTPEGAHVRFDSWHDGPDAWFQAEWQKSTT